ncbi:ABC transporter permease [Lacrimispora sp. NSJ-141]|uniref:ABC transporter permease n=1 Tax=Lientehia hominis TaxID=2897778 RepID=A0AAP2W8K9_9FIRM|nr:ABC transporter permease [Lientehia hominis]MCD2492161.1 ABC transporter permease [Lientehia hominis]
MMTLLVLRERIKKFYARYGVHILRVLRFLVSLAVFMAVDGFMGYMERLNHIWLSVGLAAVCGFLPNGAVVVAAGIFVLVHMYAVSLEVFFVAAAVLLLFFCLYYVFQPGDSIVLILMPLMFVCRIPLIIPLALGLTGSVFSVIPMSFGIIIYYMLKFVKDNVGVLASTGSLSMPGRYTQMINGILGNREMWVMVGAFCVTLLVVYMIRRLSANRAWEIAIVTGTLVNILLLFAGVFLADIDLSVVTVIVGAVLAAAVGFLLEFFLFHLDYSRTEYVQFQDDDYYYYVKAVPKVAVTQPEVTVRKINPKNRGESEDGEELFTLHQDMGSTSEILTAGKDLEKTKDLFREGNKKDLEDTQVLSGKTQPLEKAEEPRETDYDETV